MQGDDDRAEHPAGRRLFGVTADGRAVDAFTLISPRGLRATILTLGATLQSLIAPDRDGRMGDIVLGHDAAEPYWRTPAYLGVTVGRHANRIGHGGFVLDGAGFKLARNDGDHHLHGGDAGFDQRLWAVTAFDPPGSLTLNLISEDGDEGYPGRLETTCRFTLDDAGLTIFFEAKTDRATVVNLTNHAYFNLSGADGRSALDHALTLQADAFTPVDAGLIPTGEFRPVAGTPFDFREPTRIRDRVDEVSDDQIRRGHGYDHNFVVRGERGVLRPAARLDDPVSGRRLDVLTTEAGLQLYSGNHLNDALIGKGGRVLVRGDGVCLEPQAFPDAPNRPEFPSTRLDPDQTYRHALALRPSTFGAD
ncbi:MAG: galactose mutarotase [Brevundimonas sp.]|nr:MAG: galactose mutarotase [Brevundimonas sp.]